MLRVSFLLLLLSGPAAFSQKVSVINYPDLEAIINRKSDKILVINFWATWCGPCIAELPQFEKLHNERADIEVTLVSLDFVEKVSRVESFVKRKNLKAKVVLLDEIDGNSYIDKVEPQWSGAIPATLIIDNSTGKRKFVGKELKDGELKTIVDQFVKN